MRYKITHFALLIITFLPGAFLNAQDVNTIENLVLEGGGIRGIAYVGAIQELEMQDKIQSIKRVGGTSAGAITALLLSLGYNAQEMDSILFETNFGSFNQGQFIFIGGISRMFKRYGWYRHERFRKWLEQLIIGKTGSPNLTFDNLRELSSSNSQYKELFVVGTSLTKQAPITFSHHSFPDMPISDAVLISMSVPLYFEAVFMEPDGTVVPAKKASDSCHVMIDGGVVANYPIHIFDKEPFVQGNEINNQTLGLRLESDEQYTYQKSHEGLAPQQIHSIKDYTNAFYTLIIEQLNRQQLQKEDWNRTISIPTRGIGPKVKRLSKEQKTLLTEAGKTGVRDYFD